MTFREMVTRCFCAYTSNTTTCRQRRDTLLTWALADAKAIMAATSGEDDDVVFTALAEAERFAAEGHDG